MWSILYLMKKKKKTKQDRDSEDSIRISKQITQGWARWCFKIRDLLLIQPRWRWFERTRSNDVSRLVAHKLPHFYSDPLNLSWRGDRYVWHHICPPFPNGRLWICEKQVLFLLDLVSSHTKKKEKKKKENKRQDVYLTWKSSCTMLYWNRDF